MIPKHIFREYDIRGLAEKELTDETTRLIGQAFGSFLSEEKERKRGGEVEERGEAGEGGKKGEGEKKEGGRKGEERKEGERGEGRDAKKGKKRAGKGGGGSARRIKVAVARDLRPSSERLQKALVEGLGSAGIDVLDLGLIPTPLLYFGVVHFQQDAGISITGSHNPPEYNGFKFQLAERPFYGEDIRRLAAWIEGEGREKGEAERQRDREAEKKRGGERGREGKETLRRGRIQSLDVMEPYLGALKDQFHYSKKWKVVIDSGHGMGGLVAPRLFRELDQEVIELYSDLDPSFPDHHPDPSVPENMEDLSQAVKREGAALGIAFDGDMDRIGVVDEKGRILPSDRLLLIYAREVLKKNRGTAVIGDVKCSPLLYREIARQGGRPILWKTGHSLIKAKMKEEKALLGGELSGHMFFADRWYGFDDALYAACRIVEILDEGKHSLSELTADLPQMVSTPEIRVEVADDGKKFEIVRKVVSDLKKWGRFSPESPENRPQIIDIDGARIEFEDGWGLIRASNTQPVLVMRFEARSEKRLAEIRSLIESKIQKYA